MGSLQRAKFIAYPLPPSYPNPVNILGFQVSLFLNQRNVHTSEWVKLYLSNAALVRFKQSKSNKRRTSCNYV